MKNFFYLEWEYVTFSYVGNVGNMRRTYVRYGLMTLFYFERALNKIDFDYSLLILFYFCT